MKLTFEIDGATQSIVRTDTNGPASDSENYLEAEFTCVGMDGMIVTPEFIRLSVGYMPEFAHTETDDGITVTCLVPQEVIKGLAFFVTAFGYDAESKKRVTLPSVKIPVIKSGYVGDCKSTKPSPSVYEQILANTETTKQLVQDVYDAYGTSESIGDLLDKINGEVI